MALQIRRGTYAELQTITPLEGELIYTTDTEEVYIGDGVTQGGILVTGSLADLDISSVDVPIPTTTLKDNNSTGTIVISDGASNYSVRVSTTGTYVTGPLVILTTATITTLRFADGTTQTTADTANPDQALNTTSNVRFAGLTITNNLVVNGDITANKLTIQYTTVTTTIVETDDVIRTTNSTAAGSGVGAIVATGGISANNLFINTTATISNSEIGQNTTFRVNDFNVYDPYGFWPMINANTATGMFIYNDNVIFKTNAQEDILRINDGGNALLSLRPNLVVGSAFAPGIITSNSATNLIIGTNKNLSQNTPYLLLEHDGDQRFSFEATSGSGNVQLMTISDGISNNPNIRAYVPFTATTATFTNTNATTINLQANSTVGRLVGIGTSWPFAESTATILTIDTTVFSGARIQVCLGATFGLDSHTEKITLDILTNGVDVLNAQSGLLSTTSTGICSYSAVLSGTDILVKAELIDPINFLGAAINGVAELVANPLVIPL